MSQVENGRYHSAETTATTYFIAGWFRFKLNEGMQENLLYEDLLEETVIVRTNQVSDQLLGDVILQITRQHAIFCHDEWTL